VDDLLATGGTASATAKLVQQIDCELVGFGFIIELKDLQGRKKAAGCANCNWLNIRGWRLGAEFLGWVPTTACEMALPTLLLLGYRLNGVCVR